MSDLVRIGDRWAVRRDGVARLLGVDLRDLLAMPLDRARQAYEETGDEIPAAGIRAPVDVQEVWAAGVTYQRSREGRREESGHGDVYDLVYAADRPELFLKATAARVVGDGEPIGIRADSGWDVPEPELALVVNAAGEIFGYAVGNDVSSRSIEGENPLYLPQAKVYDRSCALGPGIVPAWEAGTGPFAISVSIHRDRAPVYEAATSTQRLARGFGELVGWLRRALEFPAGVVLLTGTGVVPEKGFTLRAGDEVVIDVERIGTLRNTVTVVGERA